MAEIVWTNQAVECLAAIHDHISMDSSSAADRVVASIYDRVQQLRQHPRLGQRYAAIEDREVREILFGHYRIPYLVRNESRLEILGVFHAAMDINKYLS